MHRRRRGRAKWSGALLPLVILASGCADSTAPRVEIVPSEAAVDFRAVRGSTAPVVKTIAIENGGDGRLGPVSCAANPASWLTCGVSLGNLITLTANPSGLTANPPAVQVVVTAPGTSHAGSITANLIIDQPVLTLSAATVNFTSSEGGAGTTPASATVTVTNTGAGTLASLGAISCLPTPANTRVTCAVNQTTGVLTLAVNPAGLAPGTFVFPVVVSAPNDNVSKTIAVTLAQSAIPRIALSAQSLLFQTIRGAGAPAAQTVTVTNSGGGSLGTVSCPASPASWLACAVSNGGTTVTFTVNPGGLTVSPAGVSVPVSATGAANSPQQVAVNFTIRQPVLSVSNANVAFTAVAGGTTTNPTSATVSVTNSGEGTLANLGTIACVPPASSPVTCTVDQNTGDLTIVVNPTGLVGTNLYPVQVSAPNSSVARTITVSLSAAPGIALSPSDLNFQAIRGATVDIVKKVKVTNSGSGTLGAITCPANPATWLTCALGTADTLIFTAKPLALTVSPPEVVVPVAAVGAFNSPQNVTVNFTILQPVLSLSASVLNLTVAAGGTTAPVAVTVTNSGAGNLANLGGIACTPSDGRVSCVVDQVNGTLTITVNTATAPALAVGKYVLTLAVNAPNMSNSLQTVAIVLTVN
jgi:hypothetical protein